MGLRFRKSVKLPGGFRVNLGSHGLGWSWGVPGYRVSHSATKRTRTTSSIPGTGISYVSESSAKKTAAPTPKSSGYPKQETEVSKGKGSWLKIAIPSFFLGFLIGILLSV
jgi:hypothetical protein